MCPLFAFRTGLETSYKARHWRQPPHRPSVRLYLGDSRLEFMYCLVRLKAGRIHADLPDSSNKRLVSYTYRPLTNTAMYRSPLLSFRKVNARCPLVLNLDREYRTRGIVCFVWRSNTRSIFSASGQRSFVYSS